MADIADVRNAIVSIINGALYPNGINGSGAFSGAVEILPGYPATEDLNAISTSSGSGVVNAVVSVYDVGAPRDTNRFFPTYFSTVTPAATLAWSISGNVATLSGTISIPQNLCLVAAGVDYVRAVLPTDTINGIAAAMAAMIPGASASGASVTVPYLAAARVGVVVSTGKEVGRQVSRVQVGIYAATDAIRSSLVLAIKPVLDDQTRFTLPDESFAWIKPGTEMPAWSTTKLSLAQSVLPYLVEFPSVRLGTAAQVVAWILEVQANGGPVIEYQG